jgi:hypothetical protein
LTSRLGTALSCRVLRCRTLIVILLGAAACVAEPPTQPSPVWRQHAGANFIFNYTGSDAAGIDALARESDARAPAVVAHLGAAGMAQVRVFLYPTHAELANAVRPIVGEIPSWATGLATSAREIHLQSTGVSNADQARAAATLVTHEFAHCVTLHVNAASGNNPRWLWETVALFEAGQARDPRTVQALSSGPPALSTLNGFDSTLIYDIGHSLGAFIVERAGADALRRLILSSGDTQSVLGMSPDAMLQAWHASVR